MSGEHEVTKLHPQTLKEVRKLNFYTERSTLQTIPLYKRNMFSNYATLTYI
jgi:hypothetical protein